MSPFLSLYIYIYVVASKMGGGVVCKLRRSFSTKTEHYDVCGCLEGRVHINKEQYYMYISK